MLVWLPPEGPERGELSGLSAAVTLGTFDAGWRDAPDRDEVEVLVAPSVLADDVRAAVGELPALRLVQTLSAGVDWLGAAVPERVTLCDGSGIHDGPVAEWAMAAILAMAKRLPECLDAQARGAWSQSDVEPAELAGACVLIVGHGSIGRALEARLAPFDVELLRVARSAHEGVHAVGELRELLPRADVVVVLVPLTSGTAGLLDADMLAAMRPGALLVNAARGAVVETAALVEALQEGRIRAALDVTDPEPLPPGHPLWSAPGTLITPHVAGLTPGFLPRAYRFVSRQLARYVADEPLENVVRDGY